MSLAIYQQHRRVRRPAQSHKHNIDYNLETNDERSAMSIYRRVCLTCFHKDRVRMAHGLGAWGSSLRELIFKSKGVPLDSCQCWTCQRAKRFAAARKRRGRRRFRSPVAPYSIRGKITDAHCVWWTFRESV